MARMARVVVSGYPHHVTQRGNRRQKTFFCADDYLYYLELMSEYTRESGTEVWSYCLMPNHVYLVMVPDSELDRVGNWEQYLLNDDSSNNDLIAKHTRTGRPLLGSEGFVKELENICGKSLAPKKAGHKPCVDD